MKKAIYLIWLTAIGLASCATDELVENPTRESDGAITFSARAGKSSRAAELTTGNLQSFMVFARMGDVNDLQEGMTMTDWFGGAVEFTRTTDNSVPEAPEDYFVSGKPYYYPNDNSALTFLAYAPKDPSGTVSSTDKGELRITGFTVKDEITEQVDLITEITPAWKESGDGSGVRLGFEHALAKVYVSAAKNGNPDYTFSVAGIKFGNIAKKGDYVRNRFGREADYADDEETPSHEWTVAENDEASYGDIVYTFNPVTVGNSRTALMSGGFAENGDVDPSGAFLMIPQTLKSDVVSTDTQTPDGETYEETVHKLRFTEGVSYIALLVRITGKDNHVVYPHAKGTDNVSQEVNGVKYAWAAFPIASEWAVGHYTDYYVDFTNGAGFIPAEAEGYDIDELGDIIHVDLKYTPVLGTEIRFFETVGGWDQGNENTVGHGYEGVVNVGNIEDPFID